MTDPAQRARFFPALRRYGRTWSSRLAERTSVTLVDPDTGEEVTEPGRPGELRLKGRACSPGTCTAPLASPFDDRGLPEDR